MNGDDLARPERSEELRYHHRSAARLTVDNSNGSDWFCDRFHEYACLYWALHLSECGDYRLKAPLKALSYGFLMDQQITNRSFRVWNKYVWYAKSPGRRSFKGWHKDFGYKVWEMVAFPANVLFVASIWGFCDLLEIRINANPKSLDTQHNMDGDTALMLSCKYGNLRVAQILVEKSVCLEKKNSLGLTALRHAVFGRHVELVRYMLKKNADPNAPFEYWLGSILHSAVIRRSAGIVQLLLDAGADSNIKDRDSLTSFELAVQKGYEDVVRIFLENEIGFESLGKDFWIATTELHGAVGRRDEVAAVETLLDMLA